MKANFVPGLVLQTLGLLIVLGYYNIPYMQDLCQRLSILKEESGIIFSGISTCIAGGVIPVLFLISTKRIPREKALASAIFYICFWFLKGLEIDIFYSYQAIWFGNEATFGVIANKVLVDQFIWNPVYAAPCIALCYFWMDCGFSFKRFKLEIDRSMFTLKIPALLVSTWVVWFPMCAIIYSLPTPLQVPLFNIVLCFFVLLVNIICDDETTKDI